MLTTNGGIGKHNGKWSMVCKSCRWNTTHTTGFHDKWVADLGKNPPEGGGGGSTTPAAAITTTKVAASAMANISCTEIIDRSFVQVKNGDEQKLRRKSHFIPSHVASFFSFNLLYVLKKTNFGLVTRHIFTINIITKEDGLRKV